MTKLTISAEICKGCGLCLSVCPKNILSLSLSKLNTKGYQLVEIKDESACIGCAFCASICPEVAIEIDK